MKIHSMLMETTRTTPESRSWPHLLWLLLLPLLSCGDNERVEESYSRESRKSEKEWFWRDRLSSRPVPLPRTAGEPDLVETVRKAMDSLREQPPARTEAVQADLDRLEETAVDSLCGYASDPDRTVRWAAVSTLARIASPRCIETLAGALRDEWEGIAILAASRIGRCGEPWIIPRLIKTLGPYAIDYNPCLMVRVKAAIALIRFGNYSGVPFLIKILKDNTPAADPVREWDANPRLAWEKEEALIALTALAGDDFGFHVDASLQVQAQSALAFDAWWRACEVERWAEAPALDDPLLVQKINDLVHGLSAFQARNADGARYCLKMLGPPVVPFLAKAFRAENFYERFHALDILSQFAHLAGDRKGAWSKEVVPALEDKAPAVRMKAALALGHLGDPSFLPYLEKAFSDQDPDVRLSAIRAVGLLGGDAAGTLLEGLLEASANESTGATGEMRTAIKAALVSISPRYDDLLLDELLQDDPARRERAAEKLTEIFNEDFAFPSAAELEERRRAVEKVKARMDDLRKMR